MLRILPVLLLCFLTACAAPESSDQAVSDQQSSTEIPDELQIEVINETIAADETNSRRSIDVRLSERVSEDVLQKIAHSLKDQGAGSYDRTLIVYYLAGMDVSAGGWATSHFSPDLEVAILGTTIEQEEELASPSEARSGQEIIGTWANDRPYMANRIVLYREEGTTFSVERYADGSELEHEVSVAQTDRGTRYEKPNSHGDHFLVLPSGALEIRDDEGLITSLRPVQ